MGRTSLCRRRLAVDHLPMDTAADLLVAPLARVDSASRDATPRSDGDNVALPTIRRVLLATDFSTVSERAAAEAIRLAVENSALLVVLSVVDPRRLRLPGGTFLRRVDQERSRIDAEVQTLVHRARRAGAIATFLVWEGEPAESILAASESEEVDAIVLGSHGRGLLGRLVLGSVSARVSEGARCRVLVVAA
jgi:nucleotide-binding universal stress UspA family protein